MPTDFGGEQAEEAEFVGAEPSTEGRNYNGTSFLDMRNKKDAYVEWYRENDGDESKETIAIRYSGTNDNGQPLQVRININGRSMERVLSLKPTSNSGGQWRSFNVPIRLKRGANTIRLTSVDNAGLLIDEIEFK